MALLAATVAAFLLAERAKLDVSPISQTRVTSLFSPICGCRTDVATIDFRLRKADHLTVWIRRGETRVATLAVRKSFRAGLVKLTFTGVAADGHFLPDGVYMPFVHFGRSHLTLGLPSEIRLDTRPPIVSVRRRIVARISPDGDGHDDVFRVSYRVNKHAHAILYADGHRVEYTYREPLQGQLVWKGQINGRSVAAGRYTLEASAQDLAGNREKPFRFAVVTVRYIELGRSRVVSKPARRFSILVLTDAPHVTWRLNGKQGLLRRGTLQLRAPKKRGRYRLSVSAAGHSAEATVVVR